MRRALHVFAQNHCERVSLTVTAQTLPRSSYINEWASEQRADLPLRLGRLLNSEARARRVFLNTLAWTAIFLFRRRVATGLPPVLLTAQSSRWR